MNYSRFVDARSLLIVLVVLILMTSVIGCTEKKQNLNSNQIQEGLQLVSLSGFPLPNDLFYTDPVLTKENELILLGTNNGTIHKFTDNYFMHDINSFSDEINASYYYSHLSEYITSPSWFNNIPFSNVLSITFNPETKDIYLLIETGSPVIGGGICISNGNNQYISIVTDDTINKEIPISPVADFTKIRYYQDQQTQQITLLASNKEGLLYSCGVISEECKFTHIVTDIPAFVTWDLANDTLVGLDTMNQIHLYTLSLGDQSSIIVEEKCDSFSYPLEESMENPILQYNPISDCIIIWDAVLNGKCIYTVYEKDSWQWKQLDVSPMGVYPYSIDKNNMDEPPYDTSLLFNCFGVKNSDSGYKLYSVYTNPYKE